MLRVPIEMAITLSRMLSASFYSLSASVALVFSPMSPSLSLLPIVLTLGRVLFVWFSLFFDVSSLLQLSL